MISIVNTRPGAATPSLLTTTGNGTPAIGLASSSNGGRITTTMNPGAIRVSPGNVTFGSLTVDENSSTPYTDATQVSHD